MEICIVFGTRAEAIKLAPVIERLKQEPEFFSVKVCSTGQHRSMLDQALTIFNIQPDIDLNIMKKDQTLADITSTILKKLEALFAEYKPDRVLVQGDTTTTMAVALSAFYHKIPVDHLEAGLRTGQIYSPFPEEINRRLMGVLASVHFAATDKAKKNLLAEGVSSENVIVTGNTVIDALIKTVKFIHHNKVIHSQLRQKFSYLNPEKKLILVTSHRRENFGDTLEKMCEAIANISKKEGVEIIYPVHLNPNVQYPVKKILGELENVFLIPPQDYISMVYLMELCYLILTDSGGIQEEAPSLGKPVLVMREVTERTEGIEAGAARLIGTNPESIFQETVRLLTNPKIYSQLIIEKNPYGDGHSAEKIAGYYKKSR